jgi:hypothetical protein
VVCALVFAARGAGAAASDEGGGGRVLAFEALRLLADSLADPPSGLRQIFNAIVTDAAAFDNPNGNADDPIEMI